MVKMCADFCARDVSKITFLPLHSLMIFKVQSNTKHDCKRPSLFTFTLLHAMCVACVCAGADAGTSTLENWRQFWLLIQKQNANACGIQYTLKHYNCHLTLSKSWF